MFKTKKIKLFIVLFLVSIFFSFFKSPVLAQKEKFAVNVNPIRGLDFWKLQDQTPNDFVEYQKKISQQNNFSPTWLLRPDYFLNFQNNIFIDQKFKNDDIGIFLEVTPSWANPVGVKYNNNLPWYHSQNVFLSGYNPKDRISLIDYAFSKFKDIFGFYPKSVGAWHIDPITAEYLVEKYNVNSFLICTDQTSTDGYQIWGGWWGIPYYPSKNNLLIPAQTKKDKLNAVVLWWAARDPINAYGEGKSSLYSVQANDYIQKNLDINYFHKLTEVYLNQTTNNFGQITIGLENDNNFNLYKSEYQNQIIDLINSGSKFLTASSFFNWYSSKYPNLSEDTELYGSDLLNIQKEFKWILKKDKRVGLIKELNDDWTVIDYRDYSKNNIDPYKYYKNIDNFLYWKIPAKIDSVFKIGSTQIWNDHNFNVNKKFNFNIIYLFSAIILLAIIFMKFIKKIKLLPTIAIFIGTIILSLTMIRSGSVYQFGIGFWGPNGHDGIWHLSLINQLQKSIPPQNPIYSGSILQNYHWGFDFLAAILGKILAIDTTFVYFKLLPIVLGLSIGFLSFYLAKKVTKNDRIAILFTLLNFFAGSFGWIYTLFKNHQIGGESLFWSMQSVSTLLNPPYALSLIFLLIGLILWVKNKNSNNTLLAICNGLIFGTLAGIKVYAGILIGLTIVTYWFINLVKTKKILNYHFWVWISTAIISFFILFSLGALKNSTLLEFKPLWFTHSMIESIDKFYLPTIASLRMNLSQNFFSIKLPVLIFIEICLIGIFLIGNMGMRFLGLWTIIIKTVKKQLNDFDFLMIIFMFFSFLIPQLFIQKGTAWNTIQFFYYFLFISNFFFAQFIFNTFKQKNIKNYIFIFLIFILSVLTSYATIKDYLGNPPPAAIPLKEVEALNFLKNQSDGYVLTYPYDKYKKDKLNLSTPIPVYLYETTAYVSAFSKKETFLEDEMNLDITGFNWKQRLTDEEKFFSSTDKFFARGFLINNNIDYIYLVNDQNFSLSIFDLQIDEIFNNGQVRVYKTRR
jgi:hypothetical protein